MRTYLRDSRDGLLRAQRNWRRDLLVISLGIVVLVVVSILAAESSAVRLALRDLHAITSNGVKPPWFAGWLVYAGAVGWFGASAVAFLGWLLLRTRPRRRRAAAMLGGYSVLTFIMGFDDLFMLHDGVIWFVFGIGEKYLMTLWVVLAVIWGLAFLPELLRDPDMPIFVAAVLFFAYGIGADLVPQIEDSGINEEAAKLAGIIVWALWAVFVTVREVSGEFEAEVGLDSGRFWREAD